MLLRALSFKRTSLFCFADGKRWKCKICGYISGSKIGDPANGVQPRASLKALREDWVCPICSTPRTYSLKEEKVSLSGEY